MRVIIFQNNDLGAHRQMTFRSTDTYMIMLLLHLRVIEWTDDEKRASHLMLLCLKLTTEVDDLNLSLH